MYAEKITKVADEIKEIRKELYLKKCIDSDEIREKIDNILFEMQSKLRYNIATILKDYEELKEMDSKKCIKYKQGSICRVTCQTYPDNEASIPNADKIRRCPFCGSELMEIGYEENIKKSRPEKVQKDTVTAEVSDAFADNLLENTSKNL